LKVFENRVLRGIFGPKRDEVIKEVRKLHNEELYDLYCSPYISGDQNEKNEIGGAGRTYGEEERCITVFLGKPEGKRPLARHRRRWEDNPKMDLQEVGWEELTRLIWIRIGTGDGHL